MNFIKWFVVIILLLPISAFALFKPVRVLIPEAFDVYCNEQNLCVDDVSQLDAAVSLLNDSKAYLETQWGLSIGEPSIIFCSTDKCQAAFGLSQRAGFTLGSLALLMGESWLIEGMAYSLSNDPRPELHEPFESYRQQFNNWYRLNTHIPLKDAVGTAL